MIIVDGIEIKRVFNISTVLDASIIKIEFWHDDRMKEDSLTDLSQLDDYDYSSTNFSSDHLDYVILRLPIRSEINIETK